MRSLAAEAVLATNPSVVARRPAVCGLAPAAALAGAGRQRTPLAK